MDIQLPVQLSIADVPIFIGILLLVQASKWGGLIPSGNWARVAVLGVSLVFAAGAEVSQLSQDGILPPWVAVGVAVGFRLLVGAAGAALAYTLLEAGWERFVRRGDPPAS